MSEERNQKLLTAISLCLIIAATSTAASANIIYVKQDATGNGTTWTNAYGNLQNALDTAISNDEIWVAAGTYKPDPNGLADPREATFQMINGVGIYGGFAGTETTLDQRDVQSNETILSGDLLGNDTAATPVKDLYNDPNRTDNCYHVFYHPDGLALDPNAILDGFTITDGNADGSGDYRYGGGMDNRSGSPTVIGCTFSGNYGKYGGGMYNNSSSPTVISCTFSGNSASYGGGMRNVYSTISPTVINCTFTGNSAGSYGGGMSNAPSSPIVTNCIFWGNTASGRDDIHNSGGASVISHCDIAGCGGSGAGWDTYFGIDGGGNIDAAPLFVDAAGGDLHLQNTSPCINAGDNIAPFLPATDFEGDPRIIHGIVDMGIDEVAGDVLFSLNITIEPFAGAAAVTIDPPGGIYSPGTEVTITANAEEGYVFDRFSGDVTGNDSQAMITMDNSHKYVTAHLAFTGDIIYVDVNATGLNNGTSWINAFTNLQNALDLAGEPSQIWVAAGTYYPSSGYGLGTNNDDTHFRMINGVAICGGFPPGGSNFEDRDPNQYETILSGDLPGTNSTHVFYHPEGLSLDPNAILDGFTITGGRANHDSGGGMYNYESSPTVIDCIFSDNNAYYNGAGMCNESYSSPIVSGCTFADNFNSYANFKYNAGDGMYNGDHSSPRVTDCTFTNNSDRGMYNVSSSPTVINCTFAGNSYNGMRNWYSSPTVINCTFTGNSTYDYGGGGMNNHESSPTVISCAFTGNSTYNGGGGMYNSFSSSPTVINCTFTGNSADRYGGGMFISGGSNSTVINCTFTGNSADDDGGGIYNRSNSSTVTNCILWGNTASYENEIFNYSDGDPVISHCNIEGCLSGGVWYTRLGIDAGGNIDADPLFVDATGSDLHLQNTSPCINAGDNSAPYLPDTDFEGDPRIIHGIVDMGADEVAGDVLFLLNVTIEPFARAAAVTFDPPGGVYPSGTEVTITANAEEGYILDQFSDDLTSNDNPVTIIMDSNKHIAAHFVTNSDIVYVDANAAGLNNGASWANAFADLQDALAVAGKAYEIWVAAGTYTPDPNGLPDPRDASFQMINRVAIYGGFPQGGGTFADRDPNQYETILSGDIGVPGDTSDNCRYLFYHPEALALDPNAILDGFTITASSNGIYNRDNNSPTVTDCIFTGNRNGINNRDNSNPTVISCIFTGNDVRGMYNSNSHPTVISCIFSGNSTGDYGGGGMYNYNSSSPTVISCTFTDNSADGNGGGMYNYRSSPTVISCIFSDNSAGESGGGMCNNTSSSPTVINCTFTGNSAGYDGGGMYNNTSSSPTVINCIFSGNSAGESGGGMYNYYSSSPTVINCIFSGNSAGESGGGMYNDSYYSNSSNPTVTNCIFVGNSANNNGGGISIYQIKTYEKYNIFTNCTFVANSAPNGSGLACDSKNQDYPSTVQLTNCILWDGADQIWNNDGSAITITYSAVQDDDSDDASIYPGTGNIDDDPLFVDPNGLDGIYGTEDDNLRLQAGSPCIDAGDNAAVPADAADLDNDANTIEPVPFDLNGFPRFIDDICTVDTGFGAEPIVDMGAYEYLRADINSSGAVNEGDLAELVAFWLNTACGTCGKADLTCDGNVKQPDFAALAEYWQTGFE